MILADWTWFISTGDRAEFEVCGGWNAGIVVLRPINPEKVMISG